MLSLPASLTVTRNKDVEAKLQEKARKWITRQERSEGIHASELLDPRLAYFKKTDPRSYPDRLVNTFLVGQILHAFVISAVEGGPLSWDTDIGSLTSEELGIEYSMDLFIKGKVRELKTSRSFYEPKTLRDLEMYCEQVLVYLACTNTLSGQLWILYLNLRDADKRTSPEWRCYDVTITQEDLVKLKADILHTRQLLDIAVLMPKDHDVHRQLPLCRDWLCSRKMCDYYDKCQPEGRYKPLVPEKVADAVSAV